MPDSLEFFAISLNFKLNSYLWETPLGQNLKKNRYFLKYGGGKSYFFWWYFVTFFLYLFMTNGILCVPLVRTSDRKQTTIVELAGCHRPWGFDDGNLIGFGGNCIFNLFGSHHRNPEQLARSLRCRYYVPETRYLHIHVDVEFQRVFLI